MNFFIYQNREDILYGVLQDIRGAIRSKEQALRQPCQRFLLEREKSTNGAVFKREI